MYETAWIINPFELIDTTKLLDIFPVNPWTFTGHSANHTLNSLTRFFIYYGILVGVLTGKYRKSMTNTALVVIILVIIYLYFNRNNMNHTFRDIDIAEQSRARNGPLMLNRFPAAVTTPKGVAANLNMQKETHNNISGHTINNVSPSEFNSVMNNPYMNPLIYSNCNTPSKDTLESNFQQNMGQRPLVNGVLGEKPNESSLLALQMGMLDKSDVNLDMFDSNRQFLEKQQVNSLFRQFYTLPVNGCINDQQSFAESLYGNPNQKIFKQLNIESKFTK